MAETAYTVYDNVTGEILRTGYCDDSQLADQAVEANEDVINIGTSDLTQYIDVSDGSVETRPAMGVTKDEHEIYADGTTMTTLSSVPDGTLCVVYWNRGDAYVEVDQFTFNDAPNGLELTVDTVGEYLISLTNFPYFPETLDFEGIPPP